MKKYRRKTQIHRALWVIKCDVCNTILASADSKEYLPQFSTCNCGDKNQNKQRYENLQRAK